ncbi:MAG: hypothetical protein Tsb009_19190 [Planctomycetaceae bacterium]
MADRIAVTVFRTKQRKNYQAQWTDPVSGRKKTRTTGTPIKREALRYAGKLESELNAGTYQQKQRTEWKDFRQRFERDYLPGKAQGTFNRYRTALNAVERTINPKRLAAVDSVALSRMMATMRKEQKSEATIKSHLTHLKVAFRWAKRVGLLNKVPIFEMPSRAIGSKGRPITQEEFERMLEAVPKALYPPRKDGQKHKRYPGVIDSWKHLLEGLFWSGLRLGEALKLHWTDDRELMVDFFGRYPMFRIRASAEKGKKDRTLPMAPEFAEWLDQTPEDQRTGFVFNPLPIRRCEGIARVDNVSKTISKIGKTAGVKVAETTTGKPRFATAHDLRRSFGFRWSSRVMPPILREMMRHEDISTTMKFYVGRNAEATAEAIWSTVAKHSAKHPEAGAKTNPENASQTIEPKQLTK